jgi:hypothetical protein
MWEEYFREILYVRIKKVIFNYRKHDKPNQTLLADI